MWPKASIRTSALRIASSCNVVTLNSTRMITADRKRAVDLIPKRYSESVSHQCKVRIARIWTKPPNIMFRTSPTPVDRDHDPEFDPVNRIGPSEGANLGFYQRLVVNPLLAFTLLVPWVMLFAWSIPHAAQVRYWIFAILAIPVLLSRLVQYHCVDCGRTGWYRHRNRHYCRSVAERYLGLTPDDSSRWPTPRSQLLLWIYLIIITGLFFLVLFY